MSHEIELSLFPFDISFYKPNLASKLPLSLFFHPLTWPNLTLPYLS
jgi:hypothetical protein